MAVLDKNGTEYLWNKAKEKFAAKDDVPKTPEGVVLYTEQSLTDSQKAQARGNIGAVKSWEELEDKPFGMTETEIVNVPSLEFSNGMTQGLATSIPIEGDLYTVVWDGTEYLCSATIVEGMMCLGNFGALTGGDDTGEPFLLMFGNVDGEFMFMCYDLPSAMGGVATSTHSALVVGFTAKQIDAKYIPSQDWSATNSEIGYISNRPFYPEKTYTIEWDGDITGKETVVTKEFASGAKQCLCKISEDTFFILNRTSGYYAEYSDDSASNSIILFVELGNIKCGKARWNGRPTGDIDALCAAGNKTTLWGYSVSIGLWVKYYTDSAGNVTTYTKRISLFDIKPLSPAYTDESTAEITVTRKELYLWSSTPESAKQFKLTVDDTGTISATEVV